MAKLIQQKKLKKSYQNGFNNLDRNALNDIDNIASYIGKDSEFYAKQFVKN